MRARRALVIAIATPVLLAALGSSGASARPEPPADIRSGPTIEIPNGSTADSKHTDHSRHRKTEKAPEEEPEEGLFGDLTGELFGRL